MQIKYSVCQHYNYVHLSLSSSSQSAIFIDSNSFQWLPHSQLLYQERLKPHNTFHYYTQSAVLTSPGQLVIASYDSNSVISMEGNGTMASGVDTEYSVVLKLAGLEKSAEVRVAGRSELGDGPFSEVGIIENKGERVKCIQPLKI